MLEELSVIVRLRYPGSATPHCKPPPAIRGKPNTRVTSRKVGMGAEVSFGLIKPSQPATLKITEEEVDTVRIELILSILGLAR
jgi:hypothetical protein